jgi:membrane protease YdiL (CAAX protease family)
MDQDGSHLLLIPWIIIITAVAAMALSRQMQYRVMDEARAQGEVLPVDEMSLELAGRITVGVKALTDKLGSSKSHTAANLDLSAQTERDFPLRTAILLGETAGPKQALAKLDRPLPPDKQADGKLLQILYTNGPDALDEAQRAHLVDQYGWFGQLALTHGMPPTNPQRHEALHPAMMAAAAVIGLILIGGPLLVAGLVLLVVALILLLCGSLRRGYHQLDRYTAAFLEAFAIYLGGMGLLLLGLERYWPGIPPGVRWGIYFILPFAAFWPLARGVTWEQWRQGLGWHNGRGALREIGAGVTGYITAIPVIFIGLIISAALIKASGQESTHPIIQLAGGGGLRMLGLYLLACVWAPLTEETLFRGALYTHLRQRWGWIVSGLVVAFLFAIIHPQGWVALPVLGAFAFASASIREWRSSLIGCMTAHALNNAVAVTMLVLILR